MTGEIPIAAHLLNYQHVIPYKYIVYSPKAAEDNDRFEYLHDFRALVNRALVLSPQQFTNSHGGLLQLEITLVHTHAPVLIVYALLSSRGVPPV